MIEGGERQLVERACTAFGLAEADVVVEVFLSRLAFHKFEDQLRSRDVEEQKRNRMRTTEAQAGLDPRVGMGDPYGPYPGSTEGDYGDVGALARRANTYLLWVICPILSSSHAIYICLQHRCMLCISQMDLRMKFCITMLICI